MGIEPTSSAWKAEVLPMYDTDILAGAIRIELISLVLETKALPLYQTPMWYQQLESNQSYSNMNRTLSQTILAYVVPLG